TPAGKNIPAGAFISMTFVLGASIRKGQWKEGARVLAACEFDDVVRKRMRNSYRNLYHTGIGEDLDRYCSNHPAMQRLLYLLHGPGPEEPVNQKLRVINSKPSTPFKVGAGSVQALTNVTIFSDLKQCVVTNFDRECFGFIYTGPDAKHAHWMQFI